MLQQKILETTKYGYIDGNWILNISSKFQRSNLILAYQKIDISVNYGSAQQK